MKVGVIWGREGIMDSEAYSSAAGETSAGEGSKMDKDLDG